MSLLVRVSVFESSMSPTSLMEVMPALMASYNPDSVDTLLHTHFAVSFKILMLSGTASVKSYLVLPLYQPMNL